MKSSSLFSIDTRRNMDATYICIDLQGFKQVLNWNWKPWCQDICWCVTGSQCHFIHNLNCIVNLLKALRKFILWVIERKRYSGGNLYVTIAATKVQIFMWNVELYGSNYTFKMQSQLHETLQEDNFQTWFQLSKTGRPVQKCECSRTRRQILNDIR